MAYICIKRTKKLVALFVRRLPITGFFQHMRHILKKHIFIISSTQVVPQKCSTFNGTKYLYLLLLLLIVASTTLKYL